MHQLCYFFNPQFLPRDFLKNTRKIKQVYPEAAKENLSRANVFNFMKHSQAASSYSRFRCLNPTLRILEQTVKYLESCKQKHQKIIFEHTFHFEHICRYVFNIDFEHVNPAKNRSALKFVLLMRTNTRGHILARAGFVSEFLSENSRRH